MQQTYEALNQIIFATDTRRLYMYRDPNWAYIPLNNRVFIVISTVC